MSDDANSVMKEHESLWSAQANWRSLWNEIAQFVMPAWDSFVGEQTEGVRRTGRLFDETAVSGNEAFAAAFQQLIVPQTQQYQKLLPLNEELREDHGIQEWFDVVTKRVFAARYRAKANFTAQADECFMSLGAFGNFVMFVDEEVGVGIRYRSVPMTEVCWALNHVGLVDTVYRKFKWTAKQAMQKWGKSCPEKIRTAFEKAPFTEFEFLHCVKPNPERIRGMPGAKGMAFTSWYVFVPEKTVMEYKGFRTFPYGIGRYRMAPRETYGRGPASVALPAIRTLNEQKKTLLRQGQKVIEPPILLAEEGLLTAFNQRPNAINYGMLTQDGKPLAQPFVTGGKIEFAMELIEEEKKQIQAIFLQDLQQWLRQNEQVTAYEVSVRVAANGAMAAPAGSRLQGEFLGAITEREIDILDAAGQLPPPPPQLIRSGGGYKIDYLSPLNRAMRGEDAAAIMQAAQSVSVLASLQPSVKDTIDWDGAAREVAEISGMPAKFIRSDEDLDAIRESAAQAQGAAQAIQGAPMVSQSVKNLAQAQQAVAAAGQIPTGAPGGQ